MPEKMKRKGQLEQDNDGNLMIVNAEEKKVTKSTILLQQFGLRATTKLLMK